jgi:hypothetical protein
LDTKHKSIILEIPYFIGQINGTEGQHLAVHFIKFHKARPRRQVLVLKQTNGFIELGSSDITANDEAEIKNSFFLFEVSVFVRTQVQVFGTEGAQNCLCCRLRWLPSCRCTCCRKQCELLHLGFCLGTQHIDESLRKQHKINAIQQGNKKKKEIPELKTTQTPRVLKVKMKLPAATISATFGAEIKSSCLVKGLGGSQFKLSSALSVKREYLCWRKSCAALVLLVAETSRARNLRITFLCGRNCEASLRLLCCISAQASPEKRNPPSVS